MATKFELTAESRTGQGTGASRRLRRAGKIPVVLYGAGKEPVMLQLDHDPVYHQLENEAFFTSILTIKANGAADQAVLRDIQMHPYKPRIMHIDFQRISASEKIHMRVPLHFLNQETAPGVKLQHGIVSHLATEVDVICLPKDLPEYIEVDIGNLSVGQSIHLSELTVPADVTLTDLARGNDLPVVTIAHPTVETEAAPVAAAAEAAPAAAPAAETKK
jgi:large subunit ribosomal protein L25